MSASSSAQDNTPSSARCGSRDTAGKRHFTRAELALHNGRNVSRPTLIAYKGKVYDVTRSYPWAGGVHWARLYAGEDLTGKMLAAPHGEDMLDRVPCVGILED
jgi:predicted heme/steroid binding protein